MENKKDYGIGVLNGILIMLAIVGIFFGIEGVNGGFVLSSVFGAGSLATSIAFW